MAVDRYSGKHNYYNDYEVQDFYIRVDAEWFAFKSEK